LTYKKIPPGHNAALSPQPKEKSTAETPRTQRDAAVFVCQLRRFDDRSYPQWEQAGRSPSFVECQSGLATGHVGSNRDRTVLAWRHRRRCPRTLLPPASWSSSRALDRMKGRTFCGASSPAALSRVVVSTRDTNLRIDRPHLSRTTSSASQLSNHPPHIRDRLSRRPTHHRRITLSGESLKLGSPVRDRTDRDVRQLLRTRRTFTPGNSIDRAGHGTLWIDMGVPA
jgi:hypothetical protein